MRRIRPSFIIVLVLIALVNAACAQGGKHRPNPQPEPPQSKEPEHPAEAPPSEEQSAPVQLDGRTVLMIAASVAGYSPQERADAIEKRLLGIARNPTISPDTIQVEDREAWSEIKAGNQIMMFVTEPDARAAATTPHLLAVENAEIFRQAVARYRQGHTWRNFLFGLLYAFLTTFALVALWILVHRAYAWARDHLERWIEAAEAKLKIQKTLRVSATYLGPPALVVINVVRWALVILLLQIYLTLLLSYFASTREFSRSISSWLGAQLASIGQSILNYIPNLLVLVVIILITYYLIRLNNLIFREIREGRITFRGFYPDWADPTAKLVRALIFVMAAVIIFPYLPGSKSPAFQGISIFVGLLLSLGSSSAVANAVAGTIITYMRSFQLGDWVCIGETTGEVVEKNLLVTRVRTRRNEIITIPNGTVMTGVVTNYSAEARLHGVILHTTVTIGYDAEWRQVHELLINAALATPRILADPRPFVLQNSLDDFYVSYELNAYTDRPQLMVYIYSDLHQNIQDRFNEAGVEIMSPHYSQLRDGNVTTIPGSYLPRDYEPPSFRVEPTGKPKESASPAD
jgi:small-conductance mechanosensitive channel